MEKQFYFNAQPIVVLNNYREFEIHCYEMLLRELTTDSFPGQKFFDLISKEAGNTCFLKFFAQQIRLILQSDRVHKVSINLETVQFNYKSTYQFLDELSDLAENIALEITEREYAGGNQVITDFILYAKQHGYGVLLDDIDAHSHLEADDAQRLSINGVKISHDIIKKVPRLKFQQRLAQFNANMGDLDVKVIVEGVSDKTQVIQLFDSGIRYQQGYYFGAEETTKQ